MVDVMLRFGVLAATMLGVLQDPTASLPDAYKIAFENEYVRIVRVHYDAGAKLPEHTHPAGTTVYVYLNDSDGVTFSHSGNSNRAVTRPAVKAGAIRIASGPEEHHTAENKSSSASDFLRIQVKTDSSSARSMRRMPPAENEYSNAQLRVTRIKLEQHDTQTLTAKEPALVIELPSGKTQWIAAGASAEVSNHEVPVLDLIKIEFLTKPKQ
jgi:hypothetical protein